MRGVVVCGTDTGVGKTIVSAALLVALRRLARDTHDPRPLRYWKPVQTGWPTDDDTRDVARLAGLAPEEVLAPLARLRLPASPYEAALAEAAHVPTRYAPPATPPDAIHVIEGAGGLLVPLDDATLQLDALAALDLPFLLVARPTVGTINHTLLSLRAAREAGLDVLAVIVSGAATSAVRTAMASFGRVPVLEAPRLPHVDAASLGEAVAEWVRRDDVAELLTRVRGGESQVPPADRVLPSSNADEPDWVRLDREQVWHPYTQHAAGLEPLAVASASGAWLTLADGERVLDAIASWWTTLHGHGHPAIVDAIARQAATLDHVLFAGTAHEPAAVLAERVLARAPRGLARVFYADDGSTAVEAALKMALAFHRRRGAAHRDQLIALEGGYHGDTAGAMSVSDDGVFVRDFGALRVPVTRVPAPVRGESLDRCLEALDATLARMGDRAAALIVEPLLMGASGMLTFPEAWLRALRERTSAHGVLLVADEVFTGFGRTGALFACQRARVEPDLLVIGKAITGGTMTLAAVLATDAVFRAFLGAGVESAFLHGHSYTANPIACAAAIASLELLDANALRRAEALGARIGRGLEPLVGRAGVRDVRGIGSVRAVELEDPDGRGYLAAAGPRMARAARELGVLLRPLGPVVYTVPPLCLTDDEADLVASAMVRAVEAGLEGP